MITSTEFLKVTVLDNPDFRGDTGYIHKLAIVAVLPDNRRGGSLIQLANGNQVYVQESVSEVMSGLESAQRP